MPVARAATSPDLSDFAPTATRTRRAKGEDHIPRPPNSFMCYRSDMCRKHKSHPLLKNDLTVHPSRHVADMWKNAPAEIRDYYKDMAKMKADEHKHLYPDYKYSPVHTQRKGKPTKASLARQRKVAELGTSQSSSSTPPPLTPLDLPTPTSLGLPSLHLTAPAEFGGPPAFSLPALAAPQPMQAFLPRFATPPPGPSLMVPYGRRRSSVAWELGHRRSISCPTSSQLPMFLHRSSLEDTDVPALRSEFTFPPLEQMQHSFEAPQFMFPPPAHPPPFAPHQQDAPMFTDPFSGAPAFAEPGCGGAGFADPFGLHLVLPAAPRGSLRRAHWSPESTPDSLLPHAHTQAHMPVELQWPGAQEPAPWPVSQEPSPALAMEDILASPALLELGAPEFDYAPHHSPIQAELVACAAHLNALMLHQ